MRGTLAVSLTMMLLVGVAIAQSSEEQQVRKSIDEQYKAVVDKDAATLNRLYADDYMRIGTSGETLSKAEVIKILVGGDFTVTHTELSDLKFRLYGDVAVVTGVSTFTGMLKGEDAQTHNDRFTQVWVKRNGGWQMTLQHRSNMDNNKAPSK